MRGRVERVLWYLSRQFAVELYRQDNQAALKLDNALENFGANAQKFLNFLAYERSRLDELAQKREREFGDLSVFVEGIKESKELLIRYGQSAGQTSEYLQTSVEQLTEQLTVQANQAEHQQKNLLDSLKSINTHSDHFVKIIGEVSNKLEHTSNKTSQNTEVVTEAIQDIRAAVSTLAGEESALRATLCNIQNNNHHIAEHLQTASNMLAGATKLVSHTIADGRDISSQLKASAISLSQETKMMNDRLNKLRSPAIWVGVGLTFIAICQGVAILIVTFK